MSVLSAGTVESFTHGRISGDESVRVLAAAVRAARRYCGWYVTPVLEDERLTGHEMILDGPGTLELFLPTLNLIDITAAEEDGLAIDPSYLTWSADGRVNKRNTTNAWAYWIGRSYLWWTTEKRGITLTVTHGYEEADDFNQAVLMIASSMSGSAHRDDGAMIEKQVDDVRYRWSDTRSVAGAHLLDQYRLERRP